MTDQERIVYDGQVAHEAFCGAWFLSVEASDAEVAAKWPITTAEYRKVRDGQAALESLAWLSRASGLRLVVDVDRVRFESVERWENTLQAAMLKDGDLATRPQTIRELRDALTSWLEDTMGRLTELTVKAPPDVERKPWTDPELKWEGVRSLLQARDRVVAGEAVIVTPHPVTSFEGLDPTALLALPPMDDGRQAFARRDLDQWRELLGELPFTVLDQGPPR